MYYVFESSTFVLVLLCVTRFEAATKYSLNCSSTMAAVMLPGWQTEELEEEWVDYEEDEDASGACSGLRYYCSGPD